MTNQDYIAIAIAVFAASYLLGRLIATLRPKAGCGSGCGACPAKQLANR